MIDTLRKVSTPEGVELELRTAGVYARGGAMLLDLILMIVGISLLAMILSGAGGLGTGFLLVIGFLIWWFYPVCFEVLGKGATPGKKTFGLQVVHRDGTPVAWGASFVRNLLLTADLLPPVGMVVMLLSRDSARLGDLLAGTVVIYRDSRVRVAKLPDVPRVVPKVPLHQHEQRALVEFAERLDDWAPKRQQELADLLEALTDERGEMGVERLCGIVTHLTEGR